MTKEVRSVDTLLLGPALAVLSALEDTGHWGPCHMPPSPGLLILSIVAATLGRHRPELIGLPPHLADEETKAQSGNLWVGHRVL